MKKVLAILLARILGTTTLSQLHFIAMLPEIRPAFEGVFIALIVFSADTLPERSSTVSYIKACQRVVI